MPRGAARVRLQGLRPGGHPGPGPLHGAQLPCSRVRGLPIHAGEQTRCRLAAAVRAGWPKRRLARPAQRSQAATSLPTDPAALPLAQRIAAWQPLCLPGCHFPAAGRLCAGAQGHHRPAVHRPRADALQHPGQPGPRAPEAEAGQETQPGQAAAAARRRARGQRGVRAGPRTRVHTGGGAQPVSAPDSSSGRCPASEEGTTHCPA